ncbi:hypothetical protein C8R47DRAFT_599422 [Mycena vitilis]|nr:hypothetical protein C8R47DRAFT_599422 [Mycena vitilis]
MVSIQSIKLKLGSPLAQPQAERATQAGRGELVLGHGGRVRTAWGRRGRGRRDAVDDVAQRLGARAARRGRARALGRGGRGEGVRSRSARGGRVRRDRRVGEGKRRRGGGRLWCCGSGRCRNGRSRRSDIRRHRGAWKRRRWCGSRGRLCRGSGNGLGLGRNRLRDNVRRVAIRAPALHPHRRDPLVQIREALVDDLDRGLRLQPPVPARVFQAHSLARGDVRPDQRVRVGEIAQHVLLELREQLMRDDAHELEELRMARGVLREEEVVAHVDVDDRLAQRVRGVDEPVGEPQSDSGDGCGVVLGRVVEPMRREEGLDIRREHVEWESVEFVRSRNEHWPRDRWGDRRDYRDERGARFLCGRRVRRRRGGGIIHEGGLLVIFFSKGIESKSDNGVD